VFEGIKISLFAILVNVLADSPRVLRELILVRGLGLGNTDLHNAYPRSFQIDKLATEAINTN